MGERSKTAAPCGLYCGACIDLVQHKSCHGCGCSCGRCDASGHHERCEIYRCVSAGKKADCSECSEFPCSKLIMFCYSPIWTHHLPVLENLRRRKKVGAAQWLKEQEEAWSSKWYLKRWLWLQKKCEEKLEKSAEEIEENG